MLGSPEIDVKRGFGGAMQTFDNTRPLVAGMAVGLTRACLEETRGWLEETRGWLEQAGVEIDYDAPALTQHAAAARYLALEADYEAARLLTLQAAWMADNSKPNSLQASMAKAKAGRTCGRADLRQRRPGVRRALRQPRLRRGRPAGEVGPRRQDPRHLRGHPTDPAADRRPAAAREDLGGTALR